MSLVIASSLSQLAVGWCDAGGLHGRLHPLLSVGAIGREISGFGHVLLAQERQMRLQIVIARRQPFLPAGECTDRFLAGIQEIGDKTLVLNLCVAATGLDRLVIGGREFRILERQIGVTKKYLSGADRPIAGADFVDLKQDRNTAKQRSPRLRHLRQRAVSLPPGNARLRHLSHSAATMCAGSRMPASSISALREYSSMRSSISTQMREHS